MLECQSYGGMEEGWRNRNGYWGTVASRCGMRNGKHTRKQMYMDWKRNKNNFRFHIFRRKKETGSDIQF